LIILKTITLNVYPASLMTVHQRAAMQQLSAKVFT